MTRTIRVLPNGVLQLVPPFSRDKYGKPVVAQDPDETLAYEIDFTGFLGTDTISTSDVDGEGATVASAADTDTAVTFKVSGVSGDTGTVTTRIVTAGGITKDVSFRLIESDA